MASIRATAARRGEVTDRLIAVKGTLKERFGVDFEEQKVTNADAELAQVQQLENVAGLLEAIAQASEPPAENSEEEDSGGEENTGPLATFESLGSDVVAALVEAGYDTLEKIEAATDEELDDVPNIGPATVAKIRDLLTA